MVFRDINISMLAWVALHGLAVLCYCALQLKMSDQMPQVGVKESFNCVDSSFAELALSNTYFSFGKVFFFKNTSNVWIGNSLVIV